MTERPEFLFATCQVGAEAALKLEVVRGSPEFRLAFSRPGFVTFKLPPSHGLVADFDLKSTFARASGFSLGKTTGESLEDRAADVWRLWGGRPVRRLHVWQRDQGPEKDEFVLPRISAEAEEARQAIRSACPPGLADSLEHDVTEAEPGDFVLDCVLVGSQEWWLGYHRAKGPCSRVPGGLLVPEPKEPPVSRAWYKIEEALAWSQLPIPPGSRIADLGCAPGGTSQALLQRGHFVLGIDPATVAPNVLEHPRFQHLRKRTTQVRRREFRKIRWLAADMNVAPEYTLEAVESIVTHPEVHIRGLMLTLKLLEWQLAERIPEYVQRVRQWGFNQVHTRQLASNRQEFCLSALKKPFKRPSPWSKRGRMPAG